MSRPTPATYKTTNWPAYNEALKRRGSLTIWFDPEMNWEGTPTGRRGRQQSYSDAAIQTCLSMKVLFGMALRQTTGFVESLLRLVGLDWAVPDFSTLSRRQKTLAVNIPYRGSKGQLHLLVDIEPWERHWSGRPWRGGIKVEGEGEWHTRKHGGPKRRVWRKIHLGIDEQTLEVRAVEITASHIGDGERANAIGPSEPANVLPDLLGQIPPDEEIGCVTADGAYDTRKCHDAIAERGAHAASGILSDQWRSCPPPAAQEREAMEDRHRRRNCPQRSAAGIQIPRARFVAAIERLSPPEPRRNENALSETLGPTPHGAGLRSPGR